MKADEIRKLVRVYSAKEKNLKYDLEKFDDAEMTPNLENISIARNDAIMTIHALLDYAAMVERCESLLKDYDLYGSVSDANKQKCDLLIKHVNYILKGVKDGK